VYLNFFNKELFQKQKINTHVTVKVIFKKHISEMNCLQKFSSKLFQQPAAGFKKN